MDVANIGLETSLQSLTEQVTWDTLGRVCQRVKQLMKTAAEEHERKQEPDHQLYTIGPLQDAADMVHPANLDSVIGSIVLVLFTSCLGREANPNFQCPVDQLGLTDDHVDEFEVDLPVQAGVAAFVKHLLLYRPGVMCGVMEVKAEGRQWLEGTTPGMALLWQRLLDGEAQLIPDHQSTISLTDDNALRVQTKFVVFPEDLVDDVDPAVQVGEPFVLLSPQVGAIAGIGPLAPVAEPVVERVAPQDVIVVV